MKPRVARKTKLRELIAQRGWTHIGEAEWAAACQAIPGLSPDHLQTLGIPVSYPWRGVRQHTLDELEASLIALSDVYNSRDDLRRFCRSVVILAKDRAKWASRNVRAAEASRSLKAEMVEWMLVWLGDPSVFPVWVGVRRSALNRSR